MAIVSNITKKVDIPHEDGEWMEFKKLSWRQLEKASDIDSEARLERIKSLGGDMVSALRNIAQEQEQEAEEAAAYDQEYVLQEGILRWSYSEEVTPDNINLLDEETASWAFAEILSLNKARTEEERKNG